MKVNCLSCGHSIELDDTYSDYEGPVKCCTCDALLGLKLEEGRLKSVKFFKWMSNGAAKGEDIPGG